MITGMCANEQKLYGVDIPNCTYAIRHTDDKAKHVKPCQSLVVGRSLFQLYRNLFVLREYVLILMTSTKETHFLTSK